MHPYLFTWDLATPANSDIIYFVDNASTFARVAELADALDSGSSGSNPVWVQVPSFAPNLR